MLKAAITADFAKQAMAKDREHRRQVKLHEDEQRALLKNIERLMLKESGYKNHLERLREREAEARDEMKIAEMRARAAEMRNEEVQLQLVRVEARQEAQDDALHQARMEEAAARRDDAEAMAAERDKKANELKRSCLKLGGKLGGKSKARRSAEEVQHMPAATACEKNRRRVAKSTLVSQLAAAFEGAGKHADLVAAALDKAGCLQSVVRSSSAGQDLLFSHAVQLRDTLTDVWDVALSTELKVEVGLTDWQMDEIRYKLAFEQDENGRLKPRQYAAVVLSPDYWEGAGLPAADRLEVPLAPALC